MDPNSKDWFWDVWTGSNIVAWFFDFGLNQNFGLLDLGFVESPRLGISLHGRGASGLVAFRQRAQGQLGQCGAADVARRATDTAVLAVEAGSVVGST